MYEGKVYWVFLAAAMLLLATLACGRQETGPPATPEVVVVTATPGEVGERSSAWYAASVSWIIRSALPEPTSTSVPGGCVDGMRFVSDVTVPDGTTFAANAPFIKTWRVRNSGTCDWNGYRLVFDHGEPMGTPDQPIQDVAAGQEVEISVEMTAPGGAGHYRGYWRIQSAGGANLGTLYCDIVVPGAGEPTEEPTEEPGAGALPDLVIGEVSVWAPQPASPRTVQVIVNVRNAGQAGSGAFLVVWYPHAASAEVGCSEDVSGLPVGSSIAVDCTYTYANHGEMHWRAAVDPQGEVAETDDANNEARGRIQIAQQGGTAQTVTLQSLPAEDGYVRGMTSGETVDLYGAVRVGDGTQNHAQQGFFSFDITGIPAGATIQQAVLDLSGHNVDGSPFGVPGLGRFGVYAVSYSQLGTELYVPGLPPGSIVVLSGPPGTINVANLLQSYIGNRSRFQVRAQFEAITDNDGVGDALVFPEGGPSLTVTYVP